jgi:nucleolar GTP-binding protein
MKTTWKDIQPVPSSQEFLDIVLSRTQRRLPTQIRAGFQISRIRSTTFQILRRLKDY